MTSFASLGLDDHLLRSVAEQGFEAPTPIQLRAIPVISEGKDLAAEAQTGTGKTAAFVLPILQRLCSAPPSPPPQLDPSQLDPSQLDVSPVAVLTLAPTRELALQVAEVFGSLARHAPRPVRVLGIIGGEPVEQQVAALEEGVDVVVATPGRLLDLLGRGVLDLAQLQVLVLDEADKLLDLGFSEALADVLRSIPVERQTLVFSATLPQRVLDLFAQLLRSPTTVRLDAAPVGPAGIEQRVIEVDRDRRRMLLQHLLGSEAWGPTLVFVATQRAAENLGKKLRRVGVPAVALHGGLAQHERVGVLARFKGGGAQVMVATDIAARGIDVPRLGAVVNYDLPRSPRDYLHRIGRTGRAGERGLAISFIDHDSAPHFRVIEKHSQIALPRERVEGFPLTGEAPLATKGPPPVKGRRMSKKDKLRAKAARAAADHPQDR